MSLAAMSRLPEGVLADQAFVALAVAHGLRALGRRTVAGLRCDESPSGMVQAFRSRSSSGSVSAPR